MAYHILFTDRDGDRLICMNRIDEGPCTIVDPILSIEKHDGSGITSSIVFVEEEARVFIAEMASLLLGEDWGPR